MTRTNRKATGAANVYQAALHALKPVLLTLLAFSAVLNILMLTGSVYMLQVYDRVLSSGSLETLFGLFAIVVVLFVFLGFFDFLRVRLLGRAALRLDLRASPAALAMWVQAGLPGSTRGSPQPLRDLGAVRSFVAGPAVPAIFDTPFVVLYVGVLFLIHPWLGWLTLAGAGLTAIIALATQALSGKSLRQAAGLNAVEQDFSNSSHSNAEAITAMGMQSMIAKRWQLLHVETLSSSQRGSDPSEVLAASSRAFRMLLQSSILTVGAMLVLRGDMSGGMIIASSILSGRALAPIDQLISQWRNIGSTLAAHRRLQADFRAQPAVPAQVALPAPTGRVEIDNLTYLAPGKPGSDRQRILARISFAIASGDGLGVIGNSASGKSSLARLLVGAAQPTVGEIRLDGATFDQWDPAVLGHHIGYLPQTLTLLPGTIRDNISRFDPGAEDEDIIAAARLTGIHEMILKLPEGYATNVGNTEGGAALSGGQIQRVGLARAVFRMPALVVLDEPNSNLDVAGDMALTRTVQALRDAGSAVVIMAHRPSAIAAANRLMVLESGQIKMLDEKDKVLGAIARADTGDTGDTGRKPTLVSTSQAGPKMPRRAQPRTQAQGPSS